MNAVITGANAGLGYKTARALARSGIAIVMACRSLEKAELAREQLLAENPDASLTILRLDVSEPASIEEFAAELSGRVDHVDLLINNAGIVGGPLTRNSAGHELHLATNYLGPFALTGRLLPLMRTDGAARIVNLGSLLHRFAKLDLDDINWEHTKYNEWRAYARSKLAMVTFTMELDRRLRERSGSVIALGAHPGFARTNIGQNNSLSNPRNPVGKWFNSKMEARVPTAEAAVKSIIFAAREESVSGGEYYGPDGWLGIAGAPAPAPFNRRALEPDAAKRLWAISESMTGVSFL